MNDFGEFGPVRKDVAFREQEPMASMKVGISLSRRWTGLGDIEFGIKIAERLRESPHFQIEIYTPNFASAVIRRVTPEFPVVTYQRRIPRYGEFHYIDGKVIPEDVMISVCGSPIPTDEMLPGPKIYSPNSGLQLLSRNQLKIIG